MTQQNLQWAVPVMRAGYAGRGLIYLVVAVLSLLAIWRGSTPGGTGEAMASLERAWWGIALLALIAIGLAAYGIWRLVAAFWDLEAHGSEAKGIIARIGQVVTGLIHLGLAFTAAAILMPSSSGSNGGSSLDKWTAKIMQMPFGQWIVGIAGLIGLGAGIYYIWKGVSHKYMENLRAKPMTLKLQPALTTGLVANGAVIAIVGFLLAYAAWTLNPSEAGGLAEAFDWLREKPYGTVLVTALGVGLLGFSLFCFVNAAYRIVPKLKTDDMETLARRLAS
ncbi:DUF1206 domain-containing protein [Limimaricola sp. G21655-S1]|uniref:DUF1206 domain-containing protein n=1 Tax=Limimaricola sp. G21655-S1 TaxID=3014768 RepID=UPI0022AEA462|nr:DUF1206 domain-containing protein [Limimaricola sp. G21655-S1]MCZ4260179.1 DUF1206 domain-containing protein [Limimaricola sp. G21655-S1]